MNRAQRRGNLVWARPGALPALAVQRRDQRLSGVEFDVGLRADRGQSSERGQFSAQVRDAAGRFTSERVVPSAAPEPTTRQQRRYAARQAAKRGGA